MRKGPGVISKANSAEALTDCTIMLYVMTERWPKARKYRNALERVKYAALEVAANGSSNHTSSGVGIDAETRRTLEDLDKYLGGVDSAALPQMIFNITGAPAQAWTDDACD